MVLRESFLCKKHCKKVSWTKNTGLTEHDIEPFYPVAGTDGLFAWIQTDNPFHLNQSLRVVQRSISTSPNHMKNTLLMWGRVFNHSPDIRSVPLFSKHGMWRALSGNRSQCMHAYVATWREQLVILRGVDSLTNLTTPPWELHPGHMDTICRMTRHTGK